MTLAFISFISGVLTVLAPCILPLLPIIVGGSIGGGVDRARAYRVCFSLAVSVILFTILLKISSALISVPQYVWEWISGGVLIALGLATVFPAIWERIPWLNVLNRSGNKLVSEGYMRHSRGGDYLVGAALGPVFSTCSPTYFVILATVIPAGFVMGFIDLLLYTAGLSLTLLAVALAGQRVVDKLGLAANPRGWFKRTLGGIFILVGILIFTGTERVVETWLLNHVFDVTAFEQRLLTIQTPAKLRITPIENGEASSTVSSRPTLSKKETSDFLSVEQKSVLFPLAPELVTPDGYINTGGKPITIKEFREKKVVLLDIWTYSCINCQRTLPYLKAWYDAYSDEGLEIISIHTPEFAFEHDINNVSEAVKKFGLQYPVVLDNEYKTWNALGNQFWPRKYLVDIDGYIVYDHAGEGNYAQTESAIRQALAERANRLGTAATPMPEAKPQGVIDVKSGGVRSPEVYFGAMRNEYLGNGSQGVIGPQTLSLPQNLDANTLYLGGAWNIEREFAESKNSGAQIKFKYSAKNVYFVASADKPVTVTVLRNGVPLTDDRGADVDSSGHANIGENRLYHLISGKDYGEHIIEIQIDGAGLQAYTFTFG